MKIRAIATAALLTAAPTAAQNMDGEALFKRNCAMCHGDPNVEASVSRLGPDLHGLAGRKAGTLDFRRYSPAMRASEITWTHSTLNKYLENPRKAVRGTTMAFPGLRDEAARKQLIEYLLQTAE